MPDAHGAQFNNQIQSLGNLIQGERQEFNAQSQTFYLQAAPPPDLAPLHARLRRIDRRPQLEHLADAVLQARSQQRTRPLVVVVPSVEGDDPLMFAQRVGEYDLERRLRVPCDWLGVFDWPERSFHLTIEELTTALAAAREAEVPERTVAQEALAALIVEQGRSFAFAQVLQAEACKKRPQLLAAWADLMTTVCSNPPGGLMICFICLQVRAPAKPACKWLLQEMAKLSRKFDWCLLDRLDLLEPDHLDRWIEEYNGDKAPPLASLPFIPPAISDQVFSPGDLLRHRTVLERLLMALEPHLRPQPHRQAA